MKIQTLKINYSKQNKAIIAYVPTKPGVEVEVMRNMTKDAILAAVDMIRDVGPIMVGDLATGLPYEILVRKVGKFRTFRMSMRTLFQAKNKPTPTPAPAPLGIAPKKKEK